MMAKKAEYVFLEEWLCSSSGNHENMMLRHPSSTSAQTIIRAWADLRDSLQNKSFHSNHHQSLRTLVNAQFSLYIADPQAKLLLSILSSQKISLPQESYPLFVTLLYIWVRKSSRHSPGVIDSAVEVLLHLFSGHIHSNKSLSFFSEGVLLLGALSFVPSASEKSKTVCSKLLCQLLEEDYRLIRLSERAIPNVLAGIGYALSSSVNIYFVRVLCCLMELWDKSDGPSASVSNGLMVLHLMEWSFSNFINSHSTDKIDLFSREVLKNTRPTFSLFAVVMAAAGVLRVINRSEQKALMEFKTSAEGRIEIIAHGLVSSARDADYATVEPRNSFLLQCLSLALSKSGPFSYQAHVFLCLTTALLTEIFPLPRIYVKIQESPSGNLVRLVLNEVQQHLDTIIFKEAGAITGVFCNQYVLADEENRSAVEDIIWNYCWDVYMWHRQVALMLRDREEVLLENLEKIAESAFFMVVFFALAVTKHKLVLGAPQEIQMRLSVRILVAFSCMEYFRRMRLPEYMDTIRAVVTRVQENESACVSFVESLPSYDDMTNQAVPSSFRKMEYLWTTDEVQTARILFYLRVIPTCVECIPASVFRKVLAPTMFLYMGHPTGKVSKASHSVFVAFMSSGKDGDLDDRVTLKEQLVFYYAKRSLEGYPGITPFEGLASGVVALVRHLPAGSPSIFYCISCLIEKADSLCSSVDATPKTDLWKSWDGELEPFKQMLDLLLRLLSLVDIQVLPSLMRLLAQLVVRLPSNGQDMILNELYQHVAESDDVIRKPTLVSWLQSLSYLCYQNTSKKTPKGVAQVIHDSMSGTTDSLSMNKISARL
ncbi:uncharacterized protein [Nicotiana tomentosiformis]|uniref:uncharacterized protein n=1 Tax=Nicotiana tomentosiformis TaxID=4098 RepID=UPI00051B65FF|nr:uncharacterized protein LOC104084672 [Nicotiana tomentosiformis]XP_009586883.1 uncharacterized protein LOC104084672 [Nicotiana tomentosiformis]XP_018622347.1 uncharacterized protein LOC104084672 [Nicotiana tomentosiformis]XP_018622349.1 uncharacterized protein LOC104084672 [Nicotiana tomentosiformis]XP_033508921.1 uncharacterized protein LOC104084672 [Nicotiana tomentosiformis]